jgi:hypothetical protein
MIKLREAVTTKMLSLSHKLSRVNLHCPIYCLPMHVECSVWSLSRKTFLALFACSILLNENLPSGKIEREKEKKEIDDARQQEHT